MENKVETTYLTAAEAAEYIGLSESYLAKLRMENGPQRGPRFLRVGLRAIRYKRRDLEAWMETKSSDYAFVKGGRV